MAGRRQQDTRTNKTLRASFSSLALVTLVASGLAVSAIPAASSNGPTITFEANPVTIYLGEVFVTNASTGDASPTFSIDGNPVEFDIDSNGQITAVTAEIEAGETYTLNVRALSTAVPYDIVEQLTVNVSDGLLDTTVTSITGNIGPGIGQTIYASAAERYFSADVRLGADPVDFYVYRLTTEENDPTALFDYQPLSPFKMLTPQEQQDWYTDDLNDPSYEFNWSAFVCLDTSNFTDIEQPTNLAIEYMALDSIFDGPTIRADDNADFRRYADLAAGGKPDTLTLVGEQGFSVKGTWNNGITAFAFAEVTGDCDPGFDFLALEITDEFGTPLVGKSLDIEETIYIGGEQHNSIGITIGVTGGGSSVNFNAALWGVTTIQALPSPPPANNPNTTPTYTGPTVTSATPAAPNTQVTLTGTNLATVTRIEIDGISIPITNATATQLTFTLPATITPGLKDLKIFSAQGTLTVQAALRVLSANGPETTQGTTQPRAWTKAQPDGLSIKVYARNIIGQGKIQFFVDGREIAWIRAIDESDPKLSFRQATPYLVRTVDLNPGKNRIEIRLDGIRIWRVTYLPKP